MKAPWIVLKAVLASVVLAGCSTTDNEISQKEKDRLAREQARADQKQAQAQQKMMQNSSPGTSRKGSR
jgi:outer membrane PBP1 activator LpoA protein